MAAEHRALAPRLESGLLRSNFYNPDCNLERRQHYSSRAYSELMRIAIAIVGVIVALFGLLWALQGFGVVGGSPMSNTTTWSIIGPIVALIGIALTIGALRRKS
jgi:ABC-type antimicrobial peptide transport system permease subunit